MAPLLDLAGPNIDVIDHEFEGHPVTLFIKPTTRELSEFLGGEIYSETGMFQDYLDDNDCLKVIAAVRNGAGEIVSYVMLCDNLPYFGWTGAYQGTSLGLVGVYTVPEYRKRGLATVAMDLMASWIAEQLKVDDSVVWAQNHIMGAFTRAFARRCPTTLVRSFAWVDMIEHADRVKQAA